MNPLHPIASRPRILASAVLAAAFSSLPAHGGTLYWDANGSTPGLGGAGAWADATGNWSTDTSGTLSSVWNNANRDIADFRGTSGAVTVSGGVAAQSLLFGSGGYSLGGGTITLGRASGTTSITLLDAGAGNTTVANNLVIDDVGAVGATLTYTFNSTGVSAVSLGALAVNHSSGTASGTKTLSFITGNNASSFTLGGDISQGANGGIVKFNFGSGGSTQANALALNGTFSVSGNNSTVTGGTTINGGTVVLGHGSALGSGTITFGSSGARGDMKLLTGGAITVANALTVSGAATSQTYIGGSTAHDSTFSGGINLNAFGSAGSPGTISTPDPILVAAANGRVNFSGQLNVTANIPRGIVINGPGVVALTRPAGNTYKGYTQITSGTLLLMNTSGSATGDASQLLAGTPGVIVSGGAALGGTGISTVLASASAANSVFTPGDMTRLGVSSLGTLTLSGGLSAASGATFKFDLNGPASDSIAFGTGALTLGGTVTFDFTSLGPVKTGSAYSLFSGSGTWNSVAATYVFDTPAGYILDSTYGGGLGYAFNDATHSFTVQFAAATVPEPSAFAALAGLGALGAIALRRRRRA